MKVNWLIDYAKDDESIKGLVKAINKAGHNYVPITYRPFQENNLDIIPDGEPVVFYGSISLAREIQRRKPWIPGAIANFDNFKCTHYYGYLGQFLLNQDYMIMPVGELKRRSKEIQRWLGNTYRQEWFPYFIRPNDGTKTITGQIINKERDLMYVDMMMMPHHLVVIAPYQYIKSETRLVITDGGICTGSVYKVDGRINCFESHSDEEPRIWEFAREIIKHLGHTRWGEPDRCYTMDIGIDGQNRPRLIEINSFSCSGLYECNMQSVVNHVSESAMAEWKEHNL